MNNSWKFYFKSSNTKSTSYLTVYKYENKYYFNQLRDIDFMIKTHINDIVNIELWGYNGKIHKLVETFSITIKNNSGRVNSVPNINYYQIIHSNYILIETPCVIVSCDKLINFL